MTQEYVKNALDDINNMGSSKMNKDCNICTCPPNECRYNEIFGKFECCNCNKFIEEKFQKCAECQTPMQIYLEYGGFAGHENRGIPIWYCPTCKAGCGEVVYE